LVSLHDVRHHISEALPNDAHLAQHTAQPAEDSLPNPHSKCMNVHTTRRDGCAGEHTSARGWPFLLPAAQHHVAAQQLGELRAAKYCPFPDAKSSSSRNANFFLSPTSAAHSISSSRD